MVFLSLMLGTLVSEDLACIAAGLLIRDGRIGTLAGVSSCGLGILLGDVGLWACGRTAGRVSATWPRAARWLARLQVEEMGARLERHAAQVILASRFLPGTRLPLYVSAGFLGVPFATFAWWTFVAVVLWTPLLVLASAGAGAAALAPVTAVVGAWPARVLLALAVFASVAGLRAVAGGVLPQAGERPLERRGGPSGPPWSGVPPASGTRPRTSRHCVAHGHGFWRFEASTSLSSSRISARLARWSRWEFWPMWLFYAPVAVWIALLALRHRGLSTITAANPGIPDGGTVGESKHRILSRLPKEHVIPSAIVPCGDTRSRTEWLLGVMRLRGWTMPLVLKPDVGQRGIGVRLVQSQHEAEAYLDAQTGPVLAQPYDPGPFEAGVFYYRFPGQARGHILSITDKHFPVVIGDGRSTLEQLIRTHPRYRLQAATFVSRHRAALGRVIEQGERVQLALAGNHAQGTLFRDGMHLWTPALEQRIDEIARSYRGFFVGRFDIRYSSVDAFREGRDLAIVELNGATAESTDIYDPDRSLLSAYRRLFQQWSIVFAIGAANRAAGAPVSSLRRLAALVRAHLATRVAFEISD